jgi:CubicO group peptidase (beta-lactamase class C family)
MTPIPKSHPTPLLTRRRVLAVAAAASASLLLSPRHRLAAQETPVATPAATPATSPAAELPLPGTLAADASPQFRAVTEALVAAMRQFQVPGAALGILAGDREEHVTLGVESISSLAAVTPQTLFQIGSLTKTYTATAIWRLIDEGALALDAPIRTYLPDFRLEDEQVAAEVTISNLLDHSGGWYGDDFTETGDGDDAIARFVAERLPLAPQLFPRGEFFSYNNAGFVLLGRLLEVATGTVYGAAMQSLLLGPLGLPETLLDRTAVREHRYADGHIAGLINEYPSLAVQTPLWTPRFTDPAGGIWSTTRDIIRYARLHLGEGTESGPARLVQPESLARMREPAIAIPGLTMQMGRNWFIQEIDGLRVIMHGGDTNGQHTEFVAIPERDFAFVLLTNNAGGGALAAQAVLDTAFAEYPGLGALSGQVGSAAEVLVPPDAPTITIPPPRLSEYAGRYADPGLKITFTKTDGALELSFEQVPQPGTRPPAIQMPPSPPVPVVFLAEDIAAAMGLRLIFVRDVDGRVRWVAGGLRLTPRVDDV